MNRSVALAVALGMIAALLAACTPQTITICKQTLPAGGTGFPIAWASGGSGPASPWTTLNDGQCKTLTVGNADHFNTFTEHVPPGWAVANISCNYATSAVKFIGGNPDPAYQPGDKAVAIDLNEANVTCTFLNRPLPCCPYSFDLSTGQGGGATDALWTVDNGSAYITSPAAGWMGLAPAQWIQPVASATPAYVTGTSFEYKASFNVPTCASGHVELTGTFAADNDATALLDGNPIAGAACAGDYCFTTPAAPVPLNVPLIAPGTHVLEIDVTDIGGYSGLVVNAKASRVCP